MDSDYDDMYEDDAPDQSFEQDLQDIMNNLTPARMILPLVVITGSHSFSTEAKFMVVSEEEQKKREKRLEANRKR